MDEGRAAWAWPPQLGRWGTRKSSEKWRPIQAGIRADGRVGAGRRREAGARFDFVLRVWARTRGHGRWQGAGVRPVRAPSSIPKPQTLGPDLFWLVLNSSAQFNQIGLPLASHRILTRFNPGDQSRVSPIPGSSSPHSRPHDRHAPVRARPTAPEREADRGLLSARAVGFKDKMDKLGSKLEKLPGDLSRLKESVAFSINPNRTPSPTKLA